MPRIPPGIRRFHLPSPAGAWARGDLNISGIGAVLSPKSPTHAVVRTSRLSSDRILWLRSFGAGQVYLSSVYSRSRDSGDDGGGSGNTSSGSSGSNSSSNSLGLDTANPFAENGSVEDNDGAEGSTSRLHDVESVFPLDFHLSWDDVVKVERQRSGGPCVPDDSSDTPAESQKDRNTHVVIPRHVHTTLLGIVPLPLWLVSLNLSMAMHDDGNGWDLTALVDALGFIRLVGYEGSMRLFEADDSEPLGRYVPGFHYVVLFDGVCNLCNASVDFIIRHDPLQRFLFVAQQDDAAAKILESHGHTLPDSAEMDSVLVLTPDGVLHDRSTAALQAGAALSGPVGSVLSALAVAGMAVVPTPIMDPLYNFVGRNRYKWFGQTHTCRVPSQEERRRFL